MHNQQGQALVEYAIIFAISVGMMLGVFSLFGKSLTLYSFANLSIAALPVP